MLKDIQTWVHAFLSGAQYSDSGNYYCGITTKMDIDEGEEVNLKEASLVVIGRYNCVDYFIIYLAKIYVLGLCLLGKI